MRLQKSFTRRKNGAGPVPVLGTDGAPGTPPTGAPSSATDNALVASFDNMAGFPVQHIAVSYRGPAAAVALTAQLWVYDYLTDAWYETGEPGELTPNRVAFFDVPVLAQPPTTGLDTTTSGSIAAMLVVQDAVTPDGEYVFAMGPDLSHGGSGNLVAG